MLNGIFESAFDKAGIFFNKSTGAFNIHQNTGKAITVIGEGAATFWTKRALLRHGFEIDTLGDSEMQVKVETTAAGTKWQLKSDATFVEFLTIETLLKALN